jgi:methylmalonyl-CoA/ethylmalonyl-CoA epimerase
MNSTPAPRRSSAQDASSLDAVGEVRVDHVGIVVNDFAGVRSVLELLGIALPVAPEVEPETAMEVMWVDAGGVWLQFIRPTRSDTGAAAVLRDRGPGVHHVGLTVTEVTRTLADLRRQGVPTRDRVARQGARGARVGFLDPAAVAGVELELVDHGGVD